ncbi:sensor histidine kinase [Leifsonia sp. NPDC058230]|uniref:sensor histidine kinase n=1 Tax=Leifsonia sp. NPDC058230 TaxID=3346391 RepID=UPI0036DD77B3
MNTSTPPSWLGFVLSAIGGAAIGFALFKDDWSTRPTWVLVLAVISVSAWILRGLAGALGWRSLDLGLSVVAALAGGLVAAPTNGLAVVPAAIAVMVVVSRVDRSVLLGFGLALITIVLIAVGAVPFGSEVPAVLAMIGGVVLAVFAGLSRRQFRQSELQAVLLRERELAMREETARAELLGQRQAVARDIHDVLAHSLGGLVIQLDAVEALLEAGDADAARQRVTDARRLAADGLGEARRAVAALRDPAPAATGADPAGPGPAHPADGRTAESEPIAPAAFAATLDDLLAAHRSLGGVVDLTVTGRPSPLDPASASAVQRALQEALSNVRKHAPGEPVRAALDWTDGRVRLTVSNPLGDGAHPELAGSGGRHGLEGMRERFAALPHGGAATAGVVGDRFTVVAEAPLSDTSRARTSITEVTP